MSETLEERTQIGRCPVMLLEQCVFTGPHEDCIAKGHDGQMWILRNHTREWQRLLGP